MLNALNGSQNLRDNSNEKIIEINNLSFNFNNNILLNNINFSINYGDFACIVGKNGCGKSTFLRIILNLIKSNCDIKINTNYISYIPQSVNFNKDFPITVKEFLKYNAKELKVPFSYALSLVERYELTNCLNLLIGKLSGGQLQKLMLVRSLLKKTELLIVDEPTNNLDEDSKNKIYENLKDLNDQKITILVVEHNRNFSNCYANKIFLLNKGEMTLV